MGPENHMTAKLDDSDGASEDVQGAQLGSCAHSPKNS